MPIGTPQVSIPPKTGFGWTIVKIAVLMLSVEVIIMLAIGWIGIELPQCQLAILDAVLLTIIVAPLAYFVLVRPRDRRIRKIMTALDHARLVAEEIARVDVLTGVLSRRALLDALDQEVERAKRYGNKLSCLMLDLDRFKKLNDTYGHQFGDDVLRRIAAAVHPLCRATDHLGRYGGEEFLLVLPETGVDGAAVIAERVRAAIAATTLGRAGVRITASIGVAGTETDQVTARDLVAQADRALLEAKAAGRDRVTVRRA